MPRILKIECCTECPPHSKLRDYTSDSWETCFKWLCKKLDKPVRRYVGIFEKDKYIPEECPLSKK